MLRLLVCYNSLLITSVIQIKDGLFIGDADTSKDPEFLDLNKISNLINTAGTSIPNFWSTHGLVYLTYSWEDRETYCLFDEYDDIVHDIVEFIDGSIRHGISVLLFSAKGTGRCTAAACCYLMYKYGWGFEKTYDFIHSKKPDINLNRGFVQQLFALEGRLLLRRRNGNLENQLPYDEARMKSWDSAYLAHMTSVSEEILAEELLLINSFVNSKNTISELPGPFRSAMDTPKSFVLKFNQQLQEENIHMMRTEPPSRNAKASGGGILKGSRALRAKKQEAEKQSKIANSLVDSQLQAPLQTHPDRDSNYSRSGRGYGRGYENSPSPHVMPAPSSSSSSQRDSTDISSGKSFTAPVNVSVASAKPSTVKPSVVRSAWTEDADTEAKDKASSHTNGNGSRSTDLYDFVGLGLGSADQRQRLRDRDGVGRPDNLAAVDRESTEYVTEPSHRSDLTYREGMSYVVDSNSGSKHRTDSAGRSRESRESSNFEYNAHSNQRAEPGKNMSINGNGRGVIMRSNGQPEQQQSNQQYKQQYKYPYPDHVMNSTNNSSRQDRSRQGQI